MLKAKRLAYPIGVLFILLTGVGHTIALVTSSPTPAEQAVHASMDALHPLEMAPNRSLLDFHIAFDWMIGLMYLSFALALWMGRSRNLAILGSIVSAISAGLAFRYLPLPPAVFLATSAVALFVASLDRTR